MRPPVFAAAAGFIVLAGLGAAALLPGRIGQPTAVGVAIGGPFDLIDGQGKTVTDRDFRGRFMVIYFGYTHCPDACPTTLSDMAAAIDKLPQDRRARVVPLFITVDPDRDTPDIIGDYAHAFGPEFVGLTGTQAAISAVEQSFRVYAAKTPLKHGGYAMDHSSILYVMGPDGGFVGVISDGSKPDLIAERLRAFGV